MKFLAVMLMAALAAAGCTTDQFAKVDVAIQKSLPQVCSSATSIHNIFMRVSVTGAVSDKVIFQEAQAWSVLEGLCVDPGKATAADIAVAAANAYIIAKALKAAKA